MPINNALAQFLTGLAAYYANQNSSSSLQNIVKKEVIEYYDCVHINIDPSHNYYLTQAPYNLVIDGQEYKAAGGLLSISEYVDNANFSIDKLSIAVAGIVPLNAGDLPIMIEAQSLEYIDKPVTIYRAFFDEHKVAHTIVLFKGYIDSMSATFNTEGENTQVDIDISSHWTDFDRVSTRYTNSKSQAEFFPSDLGFDYAVDVQKEVVWKEDA